MGWQLLLERDYQHDTDGEGTRVFAGVNLHIMSSMEGKKRGFA